VTSSCEHGNESSVSIHAGNFFSGRVTIGFPRRAQLRAISYKLFRTTRLDLNFK
jgi:hypothetical protein